jgi:WD40 repeat protein
VAFSPDGRTVLTGAASNHAGVWYPFDMAGVGVRANPAAQFWDVKTGQPVGPSLAHWGWFSAVAFRPDGELVVTGHPDKTARFWDAGTGKPWGQILHHPGAVWTVAFSPDGRTVLTGGRDSGVRLWDVSTGRQLPFSPLDETGRGYVFAGAFHPKGHTVLTGASDFLARLWDARTGQLLRPLQHPDAVVAVAFRPDGRAVLTATPGKKTAWLWDPETGKPLGQPLPHRSHVLAAAWSPDGRAIVTGIRHGVARLWDPVPQRPALVLEKIKQYRHGIHSLDWNPDGRTLLIFADGLAQRWDLHTGQPIGPPVPKGGGWTQFSPDGRTFSTGVSDRPDIQLWDTRSGQPLGPPLPSPNLISSLAFSPDGQSIAIGSWEGTAQLWRVGTGERLGTALEHSKGVTAVAWSPDSRLVLTGTDNGSVQFWDARTSKAVGLPLPHRAKVVAVAFRPDGRTFVTVTEDAVVRVWETATGNLVGRPLQQPGGANGVVVGPDGRTALAVGGGGSARFWDVATGKPIGAPLWHFARPESVAFRRDGRKLLTLNKDFQGASLWEVPSPVEGPPEQVALWVQVLTGLELDTNAMVQVLDAATWRQRRQRLDELGGLSGVARMVEGD